MANQGMPRAVDDTSHWGHDFRYGRSVDQARRLADKRYGRKIESDDKRSGFTCFTCLGGDHLRCNGTDGCCCNICGKTHYKDDMAARRAKRQKARTQPVERKTRAKKQERKSRAKPPEQRSKRGPAPMTDQEKDEIVAMVMQLTKAVVDHRYGLEDQ
jgi:hypothetical protein